MSIQRVFTDIPPSRLGFMRALIAADGGRILREEKEADGEFTIVAEFPEPGEAPLGGAAAKAEVDSVSPAAAASPAAPPAAPAVHEDLLRIARNELDASVAEVPGAGDNPRILAYHATTDGGTEPDSVPWCSSFVNFCVEQAGLTGTDSKAARSWMKWGHEATSFFPGCIVVLKRGTGKQGHVGFFVGTENGRIQLLSGNQGNRVSIASFDPQLVLAIRQAA